MNGEVDKEINDIIGSIGPLPPVEPPAEPPPPGEPPPAEPPPAAPPVEPPPAEPPPGEPPPVVPPAEPPPAEPPVVPPADQEKAELLSRVETLMKQVTELSAAATRVPEPAAPPPGEPPKEETIKFIEKDEDLDNLLKTPEAFNQFMTGVVKRSVEGVFLNLPGMVVNLARQQIDQRMAIKEFYDNNKDLQGVKPFVGFVANEIAAKNPDWPLDKIISELGGEVRGRLQLKAAADGTPPGGTPPAGPAFVPSGPGARPGGVSPTQVTALEKEILDVIL